MPTESLVAVGARLLITGGVQGIGMRPTVARLAKRLTLSGFVANTSQGLLIEVIGDAAAVAQFRERLPNELDAPVDRVERFDVTDVAADALAARGEFVIRGRDDEGVSTASVPPDVVVCEECLAEIRDTTNRRVGYPFTSCTRCGPRFSIIAAMPYDRAATSMNAFSFCPSCEAEYRADNDRRCHAQTSACSNCGPRVWLVDAAGQQQAADRDALATAVRALRAGRIVAAKGLGGYQLLVDATSDIAVQRLRDRKGRRVKPLAVMVRDLNAAAEVALLDDAERRQLASPAGPIVVVRRHADASLSTCVSPGLPTVGLMLPTTPLHALLLDQLRTPLVATSGNREASVLAFDERTAERELAGIADLWLHHDRPIVRPIDDSVVRVIDGQPTVLRLARGLAPLRLPELTSPVPLVALGAQQKNAIAIWNGSQTVLGPHIGDLNDIGICTRWTEQLESLAALYLRRGTNSGGESAAATSHFVCDAHPEYFSTGWSAAARRVFHHHAHIAAVMLEHDLDGEVLGLAWDGTGMGNDGTIWGGEALIASRATFRRVGSLRPFPLPGGELAIREPWRVAAALLHDVDRSAPQLWAGRSASDLPLAHAPLMPRTSSLGRLFDAVAAIALGIATSDDDGRPAMLLELAADPHAPGCYPLPWDRATGVADWRPLIASVLADHRRGATPGEMSIRFHRAIANWGAEMANAFSELPLVIGGGCFQNALLRNLLSQQVAGRAAGFFFPRKIPPGDGGLAAGQLAIADQWCRGDQRRF